MAKFDSKWRLILARHWALSLNPHAATLRPVRLTSSDSQFDFASRG